MVFFTSLIIGAGYENSLLTSSIKLDTEQPRLYFFPKKPMSCENEALIAEWPELLLRLRNTALNSSTPHTTF